jgi:hypothetical protein
MKNQINSNDNTILIKGKSKNTSMFNNIIYSPPSLKRQSQQSVLKSIYIMGFLSTLSIAGGILGIIYNSYSLTQITFWGITITTGHIGLLFTGMGLFSMVIVIRDVVKNKHIS